MKILDRYIASAVTVAFISGVTMFMVLLCAMNLLRELIRLITQDGFPTGTALLVTAYQIPALLVYAFPMAVLLGILLTFGRMSGESEMVAMRAAGVSFVRIILPVLLISLLVAGLSFYIANDFGPQASKRSRAIAQQEYEQLQAKHILPALPPIKVLGRDGLVKYKIEADAIDERGSAGVMQNVTIIYYRNNLPANLIYAPRAVWNPKLGSWQCQGAWFMNTLGKDADRITIHPINKGTVWFDAPGLKVGQSPDELLNAKRDPADMTANDLRQARDAAKIEEAPSWKIRQDVGRWATFLALRYSTPFTCLFFAFIGASLGLRHHRTSSALGLGISLLIIFGYYFLNVYLSTFGESGVLAPAIAAWAPIVLVGILGITLTVRANR